MHKTNCATGQVNFELFHSSPEFFFKALRFGWQIDAVEVRKAFLKGGYELVFTFEPSSLCIEDELEEQLEAVFGASQNLEESWRGDDPCRSTSVGDVIKVGAEYWIVAPQGFQLGWRGEPDLGEIAIDG